MNHGIPLSAVARAARAVARSTAALALAALSFAGLGSTTPLALAQDTAVLPTPTQPERVTQSQCAAGPVSVTQAAGYVPFPGLSPLAFTAPVAGKVILHVSADLSVPAGAEARIAYLLDGAPASEGDFGPSDIASHQEYEETRTTLAVFNVAAGAHTIDVYWRVSSSTPAHTAVASRRCAVVELPTSTEQAVATVCTNLAPGFEVPITPASGIVQMPGLITPVNALVSGNAIVRLATDMFTSPGSEVRLLYKVDGGAPQEAVFGPANLANYQEFWETRNTIAMIPLTAGAHTISAHWRISSAVPGDTAIFQRGCLVIEPPTNAGSSTVGNCNTSLTGLLATDGQQPLPGLSVNVGMPLPGNAVVHLAADMGVTPTAEVRLAYSIDGAPPTEYEFGPANLANNEDFWATRGSVAIIPLSAGVHTITPVWRISGAAGTSGVFQRGCITVSPATVAGGKNFTIDTSIALTWDTGNAQTGYQLLRYNTSTTAASLIPMSAGAIGFADSTTIDNVVYCYVLAVTGPAGVVGLSNLECALTGLEAGAGVPGNFRLRFSGASDVDLTWQTPPGGLDSILVQRIPLSGAPASTVGLPGSATTLTQALSPAGTCYQVIGFKGPAFSVTNVLCGVPGIGSLAASGAMADDLLKAVAETVEGLSFPSVAGLVR